MKKNMSLLIREIQTKDAEIAGQFIYEAFRGIAEQHNFPIDFPTLESGIDFARMWINHPSVYGIAAEENGVFAGSNFLTEFDPIRAVGPITVDPKLQSHGIGRELMKAVIKRGQDAPGIRLIQDFFNTKSISIYASLGFEVKEPLALMHGTPTGQVSKDVVVRPMTENDLDECEALCKKIHGFERTGELHNVFGFFKPFVAIRENRIVAYASTIPLWTLNYGIAETTKDMCDLLTAASIELDQPVSFLLPVRNAVFHRWALKAGLRMIKPMTLMALGEYKEPQGAWFPSVLY